MRGRFGCLYHIFRLSFMQSPCYLSMLHLACGFVVWRANLQVG